MSGHVLSLFGGFDLRDSRGAPIRTRSKKSRCLLAYLALAQGQQKHRSVLAELLWGDRDDTRARHSLSQELHRLRGLFPKQAQAGFQLGEETVGIAAELLDVDVVRFERGIDAREPGAVAEAAALYTGDLMVGLETGQESFDGWLRDERERLRDRAVTAWHDVLRAQMDGPAEHAIESASRLLSIDPTSEEAHRALMQLYEKTGRRHLALRQYEKCTEVLSTELGIEPDASTRELHERISAAPQTVHVDAPAPGVTKSALGGTTNTHDDLLPIPDKPSIAVLPFENMSDDPEQEYFSDGITEDIMTGLSRFRSLFVIARNSSFIYKGRAVDTKQVGRELGVRYLLEGSVRKAGERVRISAQLIDTTTGSHIWAERYDRELSDVFRLQDEITQTIVAAIEPELAGVERDRAKRKRPERLGAWDFYQRGMFHLYQFTKKDNAEARRLCQRAIELDPNFGSAFAGLSNTYAFDLALGYVDSPSETHEKMFGAAKKAVALDERDAAARRALGWAYTSMGDHESAITEHHLAIELNPSYAEAYEALGYALLRSGRDEEAIAPLDRALRLSPYGPTAWVSPTLKSYALIILGRHEEAVEWAKKAISHPNAEFWPYAHLASALAHLDRIEEARSALDKALRRKPDFSRAVFDQIVLPEDPHHPDHYFEGLRKAGLPE